MYMWLSDSCTILYFLMIAIVHFMAVSVNEYILLLSCPCSATYTCASACAPLLNR